MARASIDASVVLVAEDDAATRRLYCDALQKRGFDVIEAFDGRDALEKLNSDVVLAVLDLRMPRLDGLQCIKEIQSQNADCGFLMISSKGEIADAVAAIQAGAIDFVEKPCLREDFVVRVEHAIQTQRLRNENMRLRHAFEQPSLPSSMVMNSSVALLLGKQIEKIASIDSTVLLTGESGTGKTTIARMIHDNSARRGGPFVVVNCAALPRELIEAELFGHVRGAFTGATQDRLGRVEVAKGGTLFLDEIGDLPLELQPKLLTLVQDRTFQRVGSNKSIKVDLRFISATHQNLEKMCESKAFRPDLFYRLSVLPLRVPALRERVDDIQPMAESILRRIAKNRGDNPAKLSAASLTKLVEHDWPGNIRELENVLERASAFCDDSRIELADLSFMHSATSSEEGIPGNPTAPETLLELEKRALIKALDLHGGNRARAARQLGISEKGLYNKMRRFGLMERKWPK